MNVNIHPLIVHFPIALLSMYTGAEILRFGPVRRHAAWFHTKAILLISGVIWGFFALQTGELAEEALKRGESALVEMHSAFANASIIVYGILAVAYLIHWIDTSPMRQRMPMKISTAWVWLAGIERKIFKGPLLVVLALVGFGLLMVTGALGGALVYGPDVDPVVNLIYKLLMP